MIRRLALAAASTAILCAASPVLAQTVPSITDGYLLDRAGDHAGAFRIYHHHALAGDRNAQNLVANMYAGGTGVAQDDVEALRWFRLAAEQGDVQSQVNVARFYERGRGVERDYAEAARWYRLAAEQGSATARQRIDEMRAEGLIN